jgi:hypothetical protein
MGTHAVAVAADVDDVAVVEETIDQCPTIVDDFTREAAAIEVDTSLPAGRVIAVLERLERERGLPQRITVDNGPEFAGKALDAWAYAKGVELQFIQPGKPVENLRRELQRPLPRRVLERALVDQPRRRTSHQPRGAERPLVRLPPSRGSLHSLGTRTRCHAFSSSPLRPPSRGPPLNCAGFEPACRVAQRGSVFSR